MRGGETLPVIAPPDINIDMLTDAEVKALKELADDPTVAFIGNRSLDPRDISNESMPVQRGGYLVSPFTFEHGGESRIYPVYRKVAAGNMESQVKTDDQE